jgi:hypothetical protein
MFECPVCGDTMTQWAGVSLGSVRNLLSSEGGIEMQHKSVPIPPRLPHPNCPKCGATMYLSDIEADDEPDYDQRKFECIECGYPI